MSTYSRVKTWSSNETLTSSDLNAEFNNIITNTNSGGLNSDNVSTSAAWTWTGTHTMSTSSKLAFIDNIYLTMGSATDGDYLLRYSASNTALELSTTNADGSGTNAVVVDIQDGTDDVRVRGGLSTDNATAPTTGIVTGGPVLSDTTNTDALGSTSVTWSDLYLGDSAVLAFGEDQDVTLTHDPDDGIFINAGMKLAFRDMGGEYIYSVSDGTLGIAAATEVDITTTTLDVNGVLDVSGNASVGGTLGVTGVGTFTAQSVHTGGIQSGSDIVSDTDSTDDLGTTSVRWANVYADAVGDSGQTLGVKATTLSFDTASTIDTSGNNALTLDAGSAVLTLDGGTLESDASTLSFDAAATIDTSGNNNLTLSAGTGTLVATAGDMTLFDDNNNADVSLSLGTSATEALVVQALNGSSDKTLEELRFTTKTASGTGDHGKMSFYVDEAEIATIDDGGIDLASGLSFTVAGSAIGGSVAADDITIGDAAVSVATTSGNITIDAQANDADVIIKVDDGGSAVTALTLDGSDEGNAIFVNDVQLKSDSAVLEFGADLDTTLTHTDGTGLTLNSTNKLTFGDAASFIQQSADGTLRIDGEAIIDLNASTRVDVSNDLKVDGDIDLEGDMDINGTLETDALTIGGTTLLANDTNDRVTTATGSGPLNGEANLTFDGSTLNVVGNAGVGIARTDGTLHVHTASSGSGVTPSTSADDLIVENDTYAGISILSPSDSYGQIYFGDVEANQQGRIQYSHGTDSLNFATGATERMRILGAGDATSTRVGIGMTTPGTSGILEVEGDMASGYAGRFAHDGNNNNRWGIAIQCGADDATGTNIAAEFYDGDGNPQGAITFSEGTVTYGAFTANHNAELPEADSGGYEYGTLVETTEIFYQKNSSGDDFERGIRYKARKSSSANSKALLGAYAGKYESGALVISEAVEAAEAVLYSEDIAAVLYEDGDELPDGKSVGDVKTEAIKEGDVKTPAVEAADAVYSETPENLHQIYVLGDGHVLCNNSQGNIEVGDGITSSTTDGIGCKATVSGLIIAIAQQDISFTGSETKLVPVQYGLQQWVNLSAIDELTARVAALESA